MFLKIHGVDFDDLTTVLRDALVLPPTGTLIYNKTTAQLEVNTGPAATPVWEAANFVFGTSAGTVLEGDNDALYVHLAGVETITGAKTFSDDVTINDLKGIILGIAGNRLDANGNDVTLDAVGDLILEFASGILNISELASQITIQPNVSGTNFQTSLVNTRTTWNVQGNGTMNARLQLTHGNGVNGYSRFEQAATNLQMIFGAGLTSFIINGDKQNLDTIIRSDTNNNMFYVDASGENIGIAGTPNANAVLDVQSTDKAAMLPRMTAVQASAISAVDGMILYVSTTDATFTAVGYWAYEAGQWNHLTAAGSGSVSSQGSIYISTSASTTIGVGSGDDGNPIKVAGTYTSENTMDFDEPVDGRLRYTGASTSCFSISASISMTGGNNATYSFYIAKNGTALTQTRVQRKLGTGADVGAMPLVGSVELATNDYIEVFVENNTGTDDVTAEFMYLTIN